MKIEELGNWLKSQINAETEKLRVKVNSKALDFVSKITYETPVDTSRALSNWRLSTGSPVSGEIDPYAEGSRGSTFGISRGLTVSFAKTYLNNRRLGENIYIINHTHYIGDLNDGTSRQAPKGFVDREISNLGNSLKVL